jgi:hypothetical protein
LQDIAVSNDFAPEYFSVRSYPQVNVIFLEIDLPPRVFEDDTIGSTPADLLQK